jgi:hypothetical protein
MLNKRHQHEIAEIKTLVDDLSRRVDEILSEVQSLREARAEKPGPAEEAAAPSAGGRKDAPLKVRKRAGGTGRKKRRPPEPAARPSAEEA